MGGRSRGRRLPGWAVSRSPAAEGARETGGAEPGAIRRHPPPPHRHPTPGSPWAPVPDPRAPGQVSLGKPSAYALFQRGSGGGGSSGGGGGPGRGGGEDKLPLAAAILSSYSRGLPCPSPSDTTSLGPAPPAPRSESVTCPYPPTFMT